MCPRRESLDPEQARAKIGSLPEAHDPADHRAASDEKRWRDSWRQDILERTLQALEREDRRRDRLLYPVLRLRIDHPEMSSQQAAAVLSERIGKPVTDGWLRKQLMKARQRFAELLLEIVAESVTPPTIDNVADELADLDLLEYASSLLKRLPGG